MITDGGKGAMRWTVLLIVVAGCGERINPNICCVTDEQCASLDIGELQPCGPGQACGADHLCVAAECETSAQCSDAAPVCRLGFCESTCTGDPDCADVAGRTHCLNSACVGCTGNEQCTSASAGICDADEHACRGCELDTECASGVCIEAAGSCALEADVLFVGGAGAADSGACTRTAPCRTIGYALSKTLALNSQTVIRVQGVFIPDESATLTTSRTIVIDGDGGSTNKPTGMPWLRVMQPGNVIVEGITINGARSVTDPTVVAEQASLTLGPRAKLMGTASTDRGSLSFLGARMEETITCTGGTLEIQDATIRASVNLPGGQRLITATNCSVTIRRSTIDYVSSGMLYLMGGLAKIENNLFTNSQEGPDLVLVRGVSTGSVFQFNTIVNTSGLDSDGMALDCDGTLDVRNNLFAMRSRHPFGTEAGCQAKFSVFDDVVDSFGSPPMNSSMHPFASLFQDVANKNFHLSSSSPARGAADPASTVSEDLERHARPSPVGSVADVGAFEAD